MKYLAKVTFQNVPSCNVIYGSGVWNNLLSPLQEEVASQIGPALLWDITQLLVIIPQRRFGTNCLSHLKGYFFPFFFLFSNPNYYVSYFIAKRKVYECEYKPRIWINRFSCKLSFESWDNHVNVLKLHLQSHKRVTSLREALLRFCAYLQRD